MRWTRSSLLWTVTRLDTNWLPNSIRQLCIDRRCCHRSCAVQLASNCSSRVWLAKKKLVLRTAPTLIPPPASSSPPFLCVCVCICWKVARFKEPVSVLESGFRPLFQSLNVVHSMYHSHFEPYSEFHSESYFEFHSESYSESYFESPFESHKTASLFSQCRPGSTLWSLAVCKWLALIVLPLSLFLIIAIVLDHTVCMIIQFDLHWLGSVAVIELCAGRKLAISSISSIQVVNQFKKTF